MKKKGIIGLIIVLLIVIIVFWIPENNLLHSENDASFDKCYAWCYVSIIDIRIDTCYPKERIKNEGF